MSTAAPPGIILLSHEVLDVIDQKQMVDAMPESYRSLSRHHVSLSQVKTTLPELADFDWITARNTQEAEVKEKLLPLLEKHPGWRIQYFGAVPIPLAMALGYQLSGWAHVDTYQRLHGGTKGWVWPSLEASAELLEELSFPQERISREGDVVIRVSLSHRVHQDEAAEVIEAPIGSVEVRAKKPDEDLLRSPQDLEAVETAFGKTLDWAHEFRPDAQIHVFAAITVGAAFRMGASINPTIHNDVQTYQYFSTRSPRYDRAFVLQHTAQPEYALTEQDRADCKAVRECAQQELHGLKKWISALPAADTWIQSLFPGENVEWFSQRFRELDLAKNNASLVESSVDEAVTEVDGGFRYDSEHKKWLLGDQFLNALRKRISMEQDRRLALRVFILHESIHRGSQHLEESLQIGRFPKVLEELDYQADVWAYLHETARTRDTNTGTGATFSMRSTLLNVMNRGIDTFWAFISSMDPSRMEVRRVHRYLIWFWKKVEIERLEDSCPANVFLKTMAEKPIVEIVGATVKPIEGRAWFHFDRVENAEIAVLSGSRLRRTGHAAGTPVADIFRGFRERDDSVITNALRPIASQFDDK